MCSTHTGYTPLSYAVCDRKSIIRCVQTESDWAYDRHLYTSNSMTSDVIRFCKHPSMLVCSALLFVYVNDNRPNCMNSEIDCDCGCALCEQNRKKTKLTMLLIFVMLPSVRMMFSIQTYAHDE